MSIKQQIIDSAEGTIAHIRKQIEDLDWVPEFPDGEGILCHGGGYRIGFPFVRALMEKNHKDMLELGFRVQSEVTEKEAAENWWSPAVTYEKDGKYIQLSYFEWKPGSVCKRHLVGKVTKEVEVCEFSCAPVEE